MTLFATLDSQTTAVLDGVSPSGYAVDGTRDGRVWEAMHVGHAFARSADFDLVHNHLDWLPLALSAHCRAPLVTTIHGFSDPRILPAYRAADSAYVSISDADRVPELDYAATIYPGIDLTLRLSAPRRGPVILGRFIRQGHRRGHRDRRPVSAGCVAGPRPVQATSPPVEPQVDATGRYLGRSAARSSCWPWPRPVASSNLLSRFGCRSRCDGRRTVWRATVEPGWSTRGYRLLVHDVGLR